MRPLLGLLSDYNTKKAAIYLGLLSEYNTRNAAIFRFAFFIKFVNLSTTSEMLSFKSNVKEQGD